MLAFMCLAAGAVLAQTTPATRIGRVSMLNIDGKPGLILGLYEDPSDDARLKDAVAAGFNLIQCAADKAAVDRVAGAGARAWVNLGEDLDLSADRPAREQKLLNRVRSLKDHPALLLWEGPDEALWNCTWGPGGVIESEVFPAMRKAAAASANPEAANRRIAHAWEMLNRGLTDRFETERKAFWQAVGGTDPKPGVVIGGAAERSAKVGEGLNEGIHAVHKADPKHLVWLNHAPRNSMPSLTLYGKAADAVGCDIYPIPANMGTGHSDLLDMTPASVGAYTDRMRASAPGKPCLMVLQGFAWRDLAEKADRDKDERVGRRPNWQETRFMAYDALLHGAAGILYWGTPYAFDEPDGGAKTLDTPLWRDLLRIARELRALEPAFVAPEVKPAPKLVVEDNPSSADQGGYVATLRQVGDDWVLIVANERIMGRAFRLTGLPVALEGRTLYRLGADEELTVQGGALRDGLRGFDVHVYATSRRFEAPEGGK